MALVTRSKDVIYLLGHMKATLVGAKLPSVGDVMRLYLHKVMSSAKTKHAAASQTIHEVEPFWQKARIPIRPRHHAIEQLEQLISRWERLKKNKGRRTKTQISNEESFTDTFSDLFDIAHQDALVLITVEEDRAFLLAQREKGRKGAMAGVDTKLLKKEAELRKKLDKRCKWEEKQKVQLDLFNQSIALLSSDDDTDSEPFSTEKESGSSIVGNKLTRKRGRRKMLTADVMASLDRTKTSSRSAVHTLSASVHASGQKVEDFNINRSSIQRARQNHRLLFASDLKARFDPKKPLTLHFDGKLMMDLTGDEKVDRLPILVSGSGVDQLLCIPKLSAGTGEAMASAMLEAVESWGIKDQIKAISFDTTSSNTGRKNGACVLLEGKLNSHLLYLACRHHVHEVMLEEVFAGAMGPSSGPDIGLFKRFKSFWPHIIISDYKAGTDDPQVAAAVHDNKSEALLFLVSQLETTQPRDDYRELLELAILFLGAEPPRGVHIIKPGALHRARFMAKLIYAYKIFLFRHSDFKLTNREQKGLAEICIFGVQVYLKSWFLSRLPTIAPANDLRLLQTLVSLDSQAAKGALKKLCGHLWYLSEELIALSFFDRDVSAQVKKLMVSALQKPASDDPPKRITVDITKIHEMQLHDFVTMTSKKFFHLLSIPDSFLQTDPDKWITSPDYLKTEEIVRALRVTNDTAERGVAMIQQYSGLLTKSEEQTVSFTSCC